MSWNNIKNIEKIKKILLKNKFKRILWENIVVEYENFFYKTPNFAWKYLFYKWINAYEFITNIIKILEENFWNDFYIVKTEIIQDEKLKYIIKQEKINNSKILTKKNLKEKEIKDKIKLLLEKNKKIWKEKWFFLDMLWTDSFFAPFSIHNILIDDKNKLYIFDFWVLNKNANCYIFKFFSYLFYYLQIFWLEKVLLK